MSDNEINISTDGVKISGDVVEDFRPAIRRFAGTAESLLRLFDNVVGIPLDYANHNLERFRKRFEERYAAIPDERRQEPAMRIGYAVIRGAAYSADEADIQEMFANLLASASDTERASYAHPGFATVIGDLSSADARVLVQVANSPQLREFNEFYVPVEDMRAETFSSSISNLVRLGLLQWLPRGYQDTDLKALAGSTRYPSRLREDQTERALVDVINDVQQLRKQVIGTLRGPHHRFRLSVTAFGRDFLAAVAQPDKPIEAPDEEGEQREDD